MWMVQILIGQSQAVHCFVSGDEIFNIRAWQLTGNWPGKTLENQIGRGQPVQRQNDSLEVSDERRGSQHYFHEQNYYNFENTLNVSIWQERPRPS